MEGYPSNHSGAAQVSCQTVTKPRNEDKTPSATRASGVRVMDRDKELFEKLLDQDVLTPPEIRCLDIVVWTDNSKYCLYHRLISHLPRITSS